MKVRIIKMGPQGKTKTITQSPLGCSSNMCGKSLSEQDQHRMKTTVWRGHTSLIHMRWQTSTPDWLDRFLFVKRYTMIQQCGWWHLIRVLNWSFNFDFPCVKLCRKQHIFRIFTRAFYDLQLNRHSGKWKLFVFYFSFNNREHLQKKILVGAWIESSFCFSPHLTKTGAGIWTITLMNTAWIQVLLMNWRAILGSNWATRTTQSMVFCMEIYKALKCTKERRWNGI